MKLTLFFYLVVMLIFFLPLFIFYNVHSATSIFPFMIISIGFSIFISLRKSNLSSFHYKLLLVTLIFGFGHLTALLWTQHCRKEYANYYHGYSDDYYYVNESFKIQEEHEKGIHFVNYFSRQIKQNKYIGYQLTLGTIFYLVNVDRQNMSEAYFCAININFIFLTLLMLSLFRIADIYNIRHSKLTLSFIILLPELLFFSAMFRKDIMILAFMFMLLSELLEYRKNIFLIILYTLVIFLLRIPYMLVPYAVAFFATNRRHSTVLSQKKLFLIAVGFLLFIIFSSELFYVSKNLSDTSFWTNVGYSGKEIYLNSHGLGRKVYSIPVFGKYLFMFFIPSPLRIYPFGLDTLRALGTVSLVISTVYTHYCMVKANSTIRSKILFAFFGYWLIFITASIFQYEARHKIAAIPFMMIILALFMSLPKLPALKRAKKYPRQDSNL